MFPAEYHSLLKNAVKDGSLVEEGLFAQCGTDSELYPGYINNNRNKQLCLQKELIKVCSEFNGRGIKYIVFKGIILSCLLYNYPSERMSNDIDIFVEDDDYCLALEVLKNEGFALLHRKESNLKHHFVLRKGNVLLELHHRLFNRRFNIFEEAIRNRLSMLTVCNIPIVTFDVSGTFVHLLYHLYMDTCLAYDHFREVFEERKLPVAERFLMRAYEIALFSEKYKESIEWGYVRETILHQPLIICFKKMIWDIEKLFTGSFPTEVFSSIMAKGYISRSDSGLLAELIEEEINRDEKNVPIVTAEYLRKVWKPDKQICEIHSRGKIYMDNSSLEVEELLGKSFFSELEATGDGLKVKMCVKTKNKHFSPVEHYDSLFSDGVHMILGGADEFLYNSIFLFPKLTDNGYRVIPIDTLDKKGEPIESSLIKCSCIVEDDGYVLTADFSNAFLLKNKLFPAFYFNFIVSFCEKDNCRRTSELVLTKKKRQWFNPLYMSKFVFDEVCCK